MPRMDGLEATRAIRALGGAHALVPIIALTANVMLEESQDCADAGMDAFLSKPVKPQVLYDALTEQIRRARLKRLETSAIKVEGPVTPVAEAEKSEEVLVAAVLDTLHDDLGNDLLAELLADFMAQSRLVESQLLAVKGAGALPLDDRDQIRRGCHDLRAVAQNCGLFQLATLSATLERVFCGGGLPTVRQINAFSQALEGAGRHLENHFPALKVLLRA
jgi:HPt (histidine-containing phosphotransfer) domain-containing protein